MDTGNPLHFGDRANLADTVMDKARAAFESAWEGGETSIDPGAILDDMAPAFDVVFLPGWRAARGFHVWFASAVALGVEAGIADAADELYQRWDVAEGVALEELETDINAHISRGEKLELVTLDCDPADAQTLLEAIGEAMEANSESRYVKIVKE